MCSRTTLYVSSYYYLCVLRPKPQCSSRHRILRMCSYTHVRPISFYSPPAWPAFAQGRKSEDSKVLSDAFAAAEAGLCSPFTENDPLLEELPPHSPLPHANAEEHEEAEPDSRVPLMDYESMHVEIFAVGAGATAAIGGRSGENTGGGTSSHSSAHRMLLVGSRHTCQGRACSADQHHAATFDQYSTSSVAGRLQPNDARFSREDIYVKGIFKIDRTPVEGVKVTLGQVRCHIFHTTRTLQGQINYSALCFCLTGFSSRRALVSYDRALFGCAGSLSTRT